ncbi:MAG TPA: hypothetical protein ENK48_05205 [Gammaproteobacteria bacterium]|nr:hypothetical protein [Gammaproteobacteria bacterium]
MNFMILPASAPQRLRLLRVPEDYERHEAYRHVTALMAEVQENNPDWEWEDLAQALEARGFMPVEHILGPSLD